MNALAQHMTKSFQEAEKVTISFHFGEIFHHNRVYYGKIGSIESVTIEEFIPGKVYSEMNVMTKLMLSSIILTKNRKEI